MGLLNSISKKVLLGYVVILTLIVAATFILSSKLYTVSDTNDQFVTEALPAMQAVNTATNSANELLMAAFGLYGYTVESDRYNEMLAEHQQQLTAAIRVIVPIFSNVNKFDQQAYFDELNRLGTIMSRGDVDWDAARESLAQLQQMMDNFTDVMGQVQSRVKRNAESGVDAISDEISSMSTWLWFIILTVVLITAAAIWFAKVHIVQPITSLAKQIDDIAESRDLTKQVTVSSEDEINVTATSFNQLLNAYRQSSQEITESTQLVFDSIGLLDHSSSHAEQQISLLSQSSEALDLGVNKLEMGIGDSAERSKSASDKALIGAEQVAKGSNDLSQTAKIIAELSNDIKVSADMLLELKNAGDKVSSVVSTIAEIAEQTNLLALNAAIEAARAGESGRGFAVVADEVRTLATRTHSSTYEINSILDTIVNSISTTVQSMEHNQSKAINAVDAANTTVDSLNELESTVLTLSDENKDLAQLAQENKADAVNMRANIGEVNDAVLNVNESTDETRQASANLNNLSTSLKDIVGQYRT